MRVQTHVREIRKNFFHTQFLYMQLHYYALAVGKRRLLSLHTWPEGSLSYCRYRARLIKELAYATLHNIIIIGIAIHVVHIKVSYLSYGEMSIERLSLALGMVCNEVHVHSRALARTNS